MTQYKLVPVEPTPEMIEAGNRQLDLDHFLAGVVYCAMLAAAPEVQAKPFGYLYPTGTHPEFRFYQNKRDGVDGMPVYTAPQPAKQPLTEDQILAFVKSAPALETAEAEWIHVARAIEAAHGIGSLCNSGMANTADVTEDMKSAVRWAPSSAYWSQKLREYFGPDARLGIDLLERQIREVQDEKAAMRARMGRLEALLDAAKKLLKELDVLREADLEKEDWMPVNEADDELRAAIAKVEGKV